MSSNASANFWLDVRSVKDGGLHPVKLTVYYAGDKRRYPTYINLTKDQWEDLQNTRLRDSELKDVRIRLNVKLTKANNIIKDLEEFSFDAFRLKFSPPPKKVERKPSMFTLFEEYRDAFEKKGQIGTKRMYNTTLNSLKLITTNLSISSVTKEFLIKYEHHYRNLGHTNSTLGINLRNIRTICNVAVSKGYMLKEDYPFKGFIIPSGQSAKKILEPSEIKKLVKAEPKDEQQKKALKYWLFSYVSNGMNMVDIALLKKTDINLDFFTFYRAKTIRTRKKDLTPVKVAIHPIAREIIDEALALNVNPDNPYLFNILSPGISPNTQKNKVQTFIKFVNKHMNLIAEEKNIKVGAGKKLGTYYARHSLAGLLRRKNVSLVDIGELLGQATLSVTKGYTDSLVDSSIKKISKLIPV